MKAGIKPHIEKIGICADCNMTYCSLCEERCPKCLGLHIKRVNRAYA
jgi:hypothetical protein